MSVSVINKLSSSFTDTSLPKLYRDPILNGGSKFLFDFLSAYCNPNADGAIANGATFNNVLDGGPVATSVTANLTNLTGKTGINNTAANATVNLGPNASYDNSGLNHEMLMCFWFKLPATGYVTSAFYSPFGYTTSNNNAAQWIFDMGSGGLTPRFSIGNGSAAFTAQAASNVTPGSIYQVAGHWKPGVSVDLYLNGALLPVSNVTSIPTTLQSVTGTAPYLMNSMKGTIYRSWMEDLAVSGNTPLAQVASDYSLNATRFV